jgi:hypothetical protein
MAQRGEWAIVESPDNLSHRKHRLVLKDKTIWKLADGPVPLLGFSPSRSAISFLYCNTRGTAGTESSPLLVPVMTTTDAVVPARNLTVSGTFSRRTITGMRCASRIHSKVGLTEGNNCRPVLPFCWAIPQPMLSTLPCPACGRARRRQIEIGPDHVQCASGGTEGYSKGAPLWVERRRQ